MHHETTTHSPTSLLDQFANHDWRGGLRVSDLQPLDRVTIRTRNSTYEIVIVKPDSADVAIRGGAFFPSFARAHVAGSSLGGCFLKLHSIHVGFRLELVCDAQSIITSAVQAIAMSRADQVM